MQQPNDDFLTTTDAAYELRLCSERVRQLADSGKLPVIRAANGYRLFRRADVLALREQRAARQA